MSPDRPLPFQPLSNIPESLMVTKLPLVGEGVESQ